MVYRKFKAEQLFNGYQFLDNDQVLITDEKGLIEGVVPLPEAGDDIEVFSGILCPGFINCHCHLELSHMKGMIAAGSGLVNFVTAVVEQRHFPEKEILVAIEKAESEMFENGIVAVGDICNNTLTIPQKKKGRLHYHNFIEVSGYHPGVAGPRFERSQGFYNEFIKGTSNPVSKFNSTHSLAPHASYSVSDELWQMIINFPGNQLLSIHNQEAAAEDEWFKVKGGELISLYEKMKIDTSFFQPLGKSSLQSYLQKFRPGQQLILVHNVHTDAGDIRFSRGFTDLQLFWCLCVNANLYISGRLPDIPLMVKNDLDIVIGTDSLASNHQLNILEEIIMIRRHFPEIGTGSLLKWATLNGAKALKMDNTLGSFEKGKQPGVIGIDRDFKKVERIL